MAIIATGLTLRIFQACYVSAFLPAQRASTGQGVTEAVLLRFIGLSKQAKKRNQSLSPGDKLILHQSLPAHCPETEGCLNVCSFHHCCLTNHHLPDSLPHLQQREEPFYSSPGRQATCKWQWDARFLLSQHASHYHHNFFSSEELASLLVQQALWIDGQLKHFIPHLYKRCIFATCFIVHRLHFLSQYVTATSQPDFQPPKPRQPRLLLRSPCPTQGGWKLLGPATPHSPAATGNLQTPGQGQVCFPAIIRSP